jgi:hypothetical protein
MRRQTLIVVERRAAVWGSSAGVRGLGEQASGHAR